MVDAGSFKNGITIQYENGIWQVIEFQHVKPGKGSPFVRAKLKNIISGGVIENSFRPTEKFDLAHIDRSEYQYLYADGDLYNFMNTETYDQIALSADQVGDSLKFVKENEMVKLCSHDGNVFAIEPPISVELEVTDTEPGIKGNTATGATKPAIVETRAKMAVMHMHDSHFCASSDENSCRIYNHACMNYKLGGYSRSTATMPDFSLAYALLARVAMRIVLDLSSCLECCTDCIVLCYSLYT